MGLFISGRSWAAPRQIGLGELQRLISDHLPKPPVSEMKTLDVLERAVDLGGVSGPVRFSIPGFKVYGCDECHQGQDLLANAVRRMESVLEKLRAFLPDSTPIPFKQYIIQPWADELLAPGQFAHTTFDTIRIFPQAILVDSRVYGNATHLHEALHLTQKFVGAANELEAYGLNIRSDPKFLLLNYPYFEDVVAAYFLPEFRRILKYFVARPVKENLNVSREVQWFMNEVDESDARSLAQAVKQMEPLLVEVTRLLNEEPVRASYWSAQTGNAAFLIEIAAVRLLPLPALEVSEETRIKAFAIIDGQMRKTDNVRLGYVIDRKKESLLTLKYQLKLDDPLTRLSLYFRYLKGRFIGPGGEVRWQVDDGQDLDYFAEKKRKEILKMAQSGKLTPVERAGAKRLMETLEQTRVLK